MTVALEMSWRGLTFSDSAQTTYFVNDLQGWRGLPGGTSTATVAAGRHGSKRSPVVQHERLVKAAGWLFASTRADQAAVLAQLASVMVPARALDETAEPLSVRLDGGDWGTADAQLVDFDPPRTWTGGAIQWSAQWRCPDPRIFGDTLYASANLYVAPTGLTLPQTLPVTLTAQALGGTVTVFNPGTDPEGSPAIFGLSGEQQANVGLHNATTGKRVLFSFPLGADDTLAVDTERGGAYLNGEYRPTTGFSDMVSDMRLAPGVNVIRALGYAGSTGTPALTVSFRPASW